MTFIAHASAGVCPPATCMLCQSADMSPVNYKATIPVFCNVACCECMRICIFKMHYEPSKGLESVMTCRVQHNSLGMTSVCGAPGNDPFARCSEA